MYPAYTEDETRGDARDNPSSPISPCPLPSRPQYAQPSQNTPSRALSEDSRAPGSPPWDPPLQGCAPTLHPHLPPPRLHRLPPPPRQTGRRMTTLEPACMPIATQKGAPAEVLDTLLWKLWKGRGARRWAGGARRDGRRIERRRAREGEETGGEREGGGTLNSLRIDAGVGGSMTTGGSVAAGSAAHEGKAQGWGAGE